jgi:hypothetical protein
MRVMYTQLARGSSRRSRRPHDLHSLVTVTRGANRGLGLERLWLGVSRRMYLWGEPVVHVMGYTSDEADARGEGIEASQQGCNIRCVGIREDTHRRTI